MIDLPSFMRSTEPTLAEQFEQRMIETNERKRARSVATDESEFDKLKNKLAHRKGVTNPAGLAYHIGEEKYGKKGMEKKSAAGRSKDCSGAAMDHRKRMHDALERVLGARAAKK